MLRQFLRSGQKRIAKNPRQTNILASLVAPGATNKQALGFGGVSMAQQMRFFSNHLNKDTETELKMPKLKDSFAADLPLTGILNWVLRFADKDPKEQEKKDK